MEIFDAIIIGAGACQSAATQVCLYQRPMETYLRGARFSNSYRILISAGIVDWPFNVIPTILCFDFSRNL